MKDVGRNGPDNEWDGFTMAGGYAIFWAGLTCGFSNLLCGYGFVYCMLLECLKSRLMYSIYGCFAPPGYASE